MKSLSVRAPWWWYIVHGYKDIENREWRTQFRGRVYIHASKWWNGDAVLAGLCDINERCIEGGITLPPRLSDLKVEGGCIVGSVEIVDCVTAHNSRWFMGRYGFVLRNAVTLERPVPCRGSLGFFNVPDWLIGDAA